MTNSTVMILWGVMLIIIGAIYIFKPNLFRRWFWKRTDIFQQIFSPKNYLIFMRILGAILIVIGIILLFLFLL
jgi:uncharacterized membrane protein YdcZ (DUF606 family)